jgi:hypothetical protein
MPGNPVPSPVTGESTTVAIQLSSTATDQFIHFNMTIGQISLTNKAGKVTTIFNTPMDVDFMPSNGNAAPFATVSVPQDVYTSASISLSVPRFSYIFTNSQGVTFATDGYGNGYSPTPPVVTMTGPITISGQTMGLTLNLEASKSGTITGFPNQTAFSITPTFTLSSFAIPAEATTPQNGKCIGIAAQVTAIDTGADSMTITLAGHPLVIGQSLTVKFNSATQFQGIASASDLSDGALVYMDLALQPDASYTATRIEVDDAIATNVASGLLALVDPSAHLISLTATEEQGNILSTLPVGMGYFYEYASSTKFQTSAQFPNLSKLPFTANFSSATLAAGQKISFGSTSISFSSGTYTSPTSITLVPQTIDGTITAVSDSGNYTVYAVRLAAYDPIVQLNSSAGNAIYTHLSNANAVNIYVDSSASLLNASPLDVGGIFRFTGLLFNDAGTLRMVCNQVNVGVSQ